MAIYTTNKIHIKMLKNREFKIFDYFYFLLKQFLRSGESLYFISYLPLKGQISREVGSLPWYLEIKLLMVLSLY